MKNFFASKLNWTGIMLVLMALLPIIDKQDFTAMTAKDYVIFAIGLAVVILRTYFTSTKIGKEAKVD